MLIGQEHNFILEKISKWNLNWVVGFSLAFSTLFNIGHIFQYQLNGGFYVSYEYSEYGLYLYNTYPMESQTHEDSIDGSNSLYIYFLIYFLVNYLGFWTMSTCVEVTLLRKLHKELKDKKTRLDKMNNTGNLRSSTSTSHAFAPVLSFRKRRKQEIEDKTEIRTLLMIVMDALINFFFRLPELFFVISTFDQKFDSRFFYSFFGSILPSLLTFTTDLTCFLYLLTFSANFFIYYLFNLKFKQTFSKWTHTKKRN
jgi:hypothetical protein